MAQNQAANQDKLLRYREAKERVKDRSAQIAKRNDAQWSHIEQMLTQGADKIRQDQSNKIDNPFQRMSGPIDVSIVKDTAASATPVKPLPLPVAIADSATESSQLRMLQTLSDISTTLIAANDNAIGGGELWKDEFKTGFKGFAQTWNESVGKFLPFFKFKGLEDKFDPLIRLNQTQAGFLKTIANNLINWFKASKTDSIRNLAIDENTDLNGPTNNVKDFMNIVFPENSVMKKVLTAIGTTASFFGGVGGALAGIISSKFAGLGIKAITAGMPATGGILMNILRFMGSIFRLGNIIGALLFSPIYAAIVNPDQLAGYLAAFGKIFTENVLPTFAWIAKEILPVLSLAFAGLMAGMHILLDTVGSTLNAVIIPILTHAIPAILTGIGRGIDAVWQGLKNIVLEIFGMFGVGPRSDKGFLGNLFNIVLQIPKLAWKLLDALGTMIIEAFNLQETFGMQDGETMLQRVGRLLTDIASYVSDLFNSIASSVKESVVAAVTWYGNIVSVAFNLIKNALFGFFQQNVPDSFKEKINSVVEYIASLDFVQSMISKIGEFTDALLALVPTWDDVKGWAAKLNPASWFSNEEEIAAITPNGPSIVERVNATIAETTSNAKSGLSSLQASAAAGMDKLDLEARASKYASMLAAGLDKLQNQAVVYINAPTVDASSKNTNVANGQRNFSVPNVVNRVSEFARNAFEARN